jgi:hypothetical protein
LFGHAALNFVGTSHGVDHAGELGNSTVPGILDDTSVMLSDFGIEKRSSKRFQSRQRALFVYPYQAARARDIRRQNSRQSPLYVFAAQDAPPKLGELNIHISQLWTDVGYCPRAKWVVLGHANTILTHLMRIAQKNVLLCEHSFAFSHSQGQKRKCRGFSITSASPL